MRRFKQPFRGGARRPKRPIRWSGDVSAAETATAAGAIGFLDFILPVDYALTASLEPGTVTCVRIHGSVSLRAAVNGAIAYMYVVKHDKDTIPVAGVQLDPALFSEFINGDVMWYRAVAMMSTEALQIPFDIKVNRKLEDDKITFVIGVRAQTVTWFAVGRCALLGT